MTPAPTTPGDVLRAALKSDLGSMFGTYQALCRNGLTMDAADFLSTLDARIARLERALMAFAAALENDHA